jgi:putative GTP pyrophosphokinase
LQTLGCFCLRLQLGQVQQLAAKLSKTQIDRLGDRLRKDSPSEDDVKLLDEYRRSFGEAYETVVRIVRDQLTLEPTGRPAKSTGSLIDKLHRESIRLSQVQDIAGCRVVIAELAEQEQVVASLRSLFPNASVVDRRLKPSYGYRAVHVIPQISGKFIEIQVRTSLQNVWAELSEKLSDVVDSTIKYGGGEEAIRKMLLVTSETVAEFELTETRVARIPTELMQERPELREVREDIFQLRDKLMNQLNQAISEVDLKLQRR